MIFLPFALAALSVAQQTAEDAAPYEPYVAPASAEAALSSAAFKLPDGFAIQLWAAEPLLANPVAFDIDRHGNAWVAETFRLHAGVTDMREHMDWLHDELSNTTVLERVEMYMKYAGDEFHERYETERERVRLVRDTDGDGLADTSSVFADHFGNAADGIGAGVLATDDGVYYTCMPDLWLLDDNSGDGVADKSTQLSTGYGVHVALLGHDLHGLIIGPDRRLYFSCGDRGFNVLTQEGTRLVSPRTGAVLRCELDGSNLEIVHSGLRNPQELAFDEYGNLFTGDNNSDGGDRARFVQIVDGADSGWRFHYQYVTKPELRGPWNMESQWKPWHAEQSAFLLPPIANVTSGPSGLSYYPGTGLSSDYDGHFFLCDFRGGPLYSGIVDFPIIPKGAGFELGEVSEFLWGCLATDVAFGPDSNLYVLDWVQGWGMTGKGRIHRVAPPAEDERARAAAVQELLGGDWSTRSAAQLRELLEHRDMRVRQAAQFALVDLGGEGRAALLEAATSADVQLARLHGIWGLGVLAREDQSGLADLAPLLADPDAEVRAQAARVLGDEFRMPDAATALGVDFGSQVLGALCKQMAGAAPRAALYAALAAARVAHELEAESPILAHASAQLLARAGTEDPVLRHAAVMGLAASCSSGEPNLLNQTNDGALFREIAAARDAHIRMGACLVARRHDSPDALGRFLEDEDVYIRREAARALHEFDEAARAHSALLAPQLERADRADPTFLRFALVANWRMGTEEAARRIMAFTASDERPAALRSEGMRMLAGWESPGPVDPISGVWFPLVPRDGELVRGLALELASSMRTAPDEALQPWLRMVDSYRLRELEPLVAELAEDSARAGSTRAVALETLEGLFSQRYMELVAVGIAGDDEVFRAACLQALPDLPRSQSLPIFEAMLQSESVSDRRAVYRALANCPLDEAADLLRSEFKILLQHLSPVDTEVPLLAVSLPTGAELELYRAVVKRLPDLDRGILAEGALAAEAIATIRSGRNGDDFQPEWYLHRMALDGGDAERGKRLFEAKIELSCLRCHPHDAGEAPSIGPHLQNVGSRLSRAQLLSSILSPNQTIAEGFDAQTIRMSDDSVLVGRVVAETVTELDLLDDQGDVWVLEKAEIAERVKALSAMPTNLPNFLTPEEMRDLIEYLAQRTEQN